MSADLKPCPFCGGEMMFRKALWPSDGCTDAVIHRDPVECGLTVWVYAVAVSLGFVLTVIGVNSL